MNLDELYSYLLNRLNDIESELEEYMDDSLITGSNDYVELLYGRYAELECLYEVLDCPLSVETLETISSKFSELGNKLLNNRK